MNDASVILEATIAFCTDLNIEEEGPVQSTEIRYTQKKESFD